MMELEISKSVLNDIAVAAIESIEGVQLAAISNLDTARETARGGAAVLSSLSPASFSSASLGQLGQNVTNATKNVAQNVAQNVTQNVAQSAADLSISAISRPKALRISRHEQQVSVDAGLNIEYGRNLLELANKARSAIAESIELMTGLRVKEITVTVQGLYLPGATSGGGQG